MVVLNIDSVLTVINKSIWLKEKEELYVESVIILCVICVENNGKLKIIKIMSVV